MPTYAQAYLVRCAERAARVFKAKFGSELKPVKLQPAPLYCFLTRKHAADPFVSVRIVERVGTNSFTVGDLTGASLEQIQRMARRIKGTLKLVK